MGVLLKLVQSRVSRDTLDMLASAKEAAEEGRVVGAAIILIHPGGLHFSIDYAGRFVVTHPALVRGMVAKLDDCLAKLPHPPPRLPR